MGPDTGDDATQVRNHRAAGPAPETLRPARRLANRPRVLRPRPPVPKRGYTLLELMIVVAILALIAALALPAYHGYMQSSREGALAANIATMEVFQEDYRLRTGAYLQTADDAAAIAATIGWRPKSADGTRYRIAPGDEGSYQVTAVSSEGTRVCIRLPERTRC